MASKIQVWLHTQTDGTLPKAALEALSAALELKTKLGGELSVGLIGNDVHAAANFIAGCGAASFAGVSGADYAVSRYATDAAAAEALAKAGGAEYIVAPATARFARALPGVAQRIGASVDTHVCGLMVQEGKVTIQRWFYRQRILGTISRAARPWILLVDGGAFPAWSGTAGTATVTAVAAGTVQTRTQVVGVQAPSGDAQTIRPDAKLLFVAGAGWTKKQSDGQLHMEKAAELIQGFIVKTQASLGSSKSLVDLQSEGQATFGFMSHLNQVGQTGSTPRHPRGLSTCCHGEEPHVVGWRFINERRAINLDPNCGWAQGKADVLYVADAFQVMAKVNELLK